MTIILLNTKENFDSVAVSTVEKFCAGSQQNNPWPYGLRKKSSLVASSRAGVELLRGARVSLRINDFFQQRKASEFKNSA